MSLIRKKNPDGTTKAWVVIFRRNGQVFTARFRASQYEKAKIRHESMLKTIPPIIRHNRGGGKQGNPRKSSEQLKVNGCYIVKSFTGIRCEKNTECHYYDECLTEVAKRDWSGFHVKNKKGVTNV